jgi:hypothetical protein
MRFSLRVLVLALVASVTLVAAAAAQAGTYTVYGCKTPTGAGAPLSGWQDSISSDTYWQGKCPGPMYLGMVDSQTHANGETVELKFTAPPGTTISSYTLRRAVKLVSSDGYYFETLEESGGVWHLVNGCSSPAGCKPVGDTKNPSSSSNLFARTAAAGTTAVALEMLCSRSGGCPRESGTGTNSIWLWQTAINLADNSSPQFANPPSGPLVSPGAMLSGVVPVTIGATDAGGGVYQASIEVDGRVLQSQVLNSNGGLCQQPFTATVPCPPSVNETMYFDTSQLVDGSHTLLLLVSDAAGNVAAWGPITITTANNPCNPLPASNAMHLGAAFPLVVRTRVRVHGRTRIKSSLRLVSRLTVSYLQQPVVRGELVDAAGRPVAGAQVCIAVRDDLPNAQLQAVGGLTTNASGGFSYRLPRGPSRTIVFIHRVVGGAISGAVNISVRASVLLRLNGHHLFNGQVMQWSGTLPGPIPPGLLSLMQVWRGTHWQTFQQIQIGRSGKWVARYRFEFTTGVQQYQFRLLIPRQSGYPYTSHASSPIRVTVTG